MAKLPGETYFDLAAETVSPRQPVDGGYSCPCCGSISFAEAGGYEICDVCGWEDDPVQERIVNLAGGANKVSLSEARKNFASTGSSEIKPKKVYLP